MTWYTSIRIVKEIVFKILRLIMAMHGALFKINSKNGVS